MFADRVLYASIPLSIAKCDRYAHFDAPPAKLFPWKSNFIHRKSFFSNRKNYFSYKKNHFSDKFPEISSKNSLKTNRFISRSGRKETVSVNKVIFLTNKIIFLTNKVKFSSDIKTIPGTKIVFREDPITSLSRIVKKIRVLRSKRRNNWSPAPFARIFGGTLWLNVVSDPFSVEATSFTGCRRKIAFSRSWIGVYLLQIMHRFREHRWSSLNTSEPRLFCYWSYYRVPGPAGPGTWRRSLIRPRLPKIRSPITQPGG